jgi:hypothetical protein
MLLSSFLQLLVFLGITMSIRFVLREMLWIKAIHFHHEAKSPFPLQETIPFPSFLTSFVGGKDTFDSKSVIGRSSTFVFLRPQELNSQQEQRLYFALHSMWHDAEGSLFVLCQGDEKHCLAFAQRVNDRQHPVSVLADFEGDIARSIPVLKTPFAVMVNEQGEIKRVGEPED